MDLNNQDVKESLQQTSEVNHKTLPSIYKKIAQWTLVGIGIFILIMMMLFSHRATHANSTVPTPQNLHQMQSAELELQTNLAKLKQEEEHIAPPVTNTQTPVITDINTNANVESTENYTARQNAPTTMYSANVTIENATNVNNSGAAQTIFTGHDAYSQFGNADSHVSTVTATEISHPEDTIASGEFIHAVLETAIDSDLPGMVRAVISEPVYAYVGEKPLIPAGSRLIGQYSSSVMAGMKRVFVIWNRIILPNGTSIQINSPGTDNLGMAGMNADSVNTHFFAQFGEAALLSVLGAGTANIGVSPSDQGNSSAMYRSAIAQSFQQSAGQSLNSTLQIKPTLKIFQGANIVVFVAHDLNFYTVLYANAN